MIRSDGGLNDGVGRKLQLISKSFCQEGGDQGQDGEKETPLGEAGLIYHMGSMYPIWGCYTITGANESISGRKTCLEVS